MDKQSELLRKRISKPRLKVSSAREVLSKFVEGHIHDSVGGVEGLLHAVAMMNVDVDVQDTLMHRRKGEPMRAGVRVLRALRASAF